MVSGDRDLSMDYDVIVIGAGPAGSATATILARAGRRVLVLERETFPRFKIGESLIPATFDTLDRLGLIDKLRASHFPKKYSVQFFSGDGRPSTPFYFGETEPAGYAQTWQVLRSEFDQLLADNARRHGVEIREGVTVKEVLFEGERAVGVRVQRSGGELADLRCRVVADASGQRAVLARQLGIRRQDPNLRMAAIFTHFEGARRDPGIDEGATLVLQTEEHKSWFWYIPLPDDRVSVGVVGPIRHLIQGRRGDPQRVFEEELARCPGLVPRIADARRTMDVQVSNDFSCSADRAAGDGWVLVGDAFTFLDPIYSSGVLLAFASAELAADAVAAALADGDTSAERLGVYEQRMRRGVAAFRKLVYAFYSPEFNFGRFLRRYPEHREPIIKILVGDVFDRDYAPLFRDVDAYMASAGTTLTRHLEDAVELPVA